MKILGILFLSLIAIGLAQDSCLPISPRLHFGAVYTDQQSSQRLVVMFNTKSSCQKSFVTVTDNDGNIRKTYCTSETLKLSKKVLNYTTVVQRCSIQKIVYDQFFTYMIYGSNDSQSTPIPYSINPIQSHIFDPQNSDQSLKMITLADWSDLKQKIGIYTSLNQSFDIMRLNNQIDGLIIGGDIGYDLDTNNCQNYQSFLLMLSRIAAFVPVVIVTGNHEYNTPDNYLLFQKSFQHHGLDTKLGVGYNFGPFFMAAFDPHQSLYKPEIQPQTKKLNLRSYQNKSQKKSLKKLQQILQKGVSLNKTIIPTSHYPLMCSGTSSNCKTNAKIMKQYFDLMFANNVNFYIGAHYHTYERIYPYCQNGTISKVQTPYTYSKKEQNCMISVVEGIAGNDVKIVQEYSQIQDFSAGISFNQTGFGLLNINQTYIRYQHYSTKAGLHVADTMQIYFDSQENQSQPISERKAILIEE